MRLGLLHAVAALMLGGAFSCQCFVPVEEFDGGDPQPVAGGRAGGVSGGGVSGGGVSGGGASGGGVSGGGSALFDGGACTSASDCRGSTSATTGLCQGSTGAWSCAFNACVLECTGGRRCGSADGGCLTCDTATVCTQPSACPWLTHLSFERSTCGLDTQFWQTRPTTEPCVRTLIQPDGGIAGTIWGYGYGALRADIPGLGGGCVGVGLSSGVVRFSLSCPACFNIVRPEIVGP